MLGAEPRIVALPPRSAPKIRAQYKIPFSALGIVAVKKPAIGRAATVKEMLATMLEAMPGIQTIKTVAIFRLSPARSPVIPSMTTTLYLKIQLIRPRLGWVSKQIVRIRFLETWCDPPGELEENKVLCRFLLVCRESLRPLFQAETLFHRRYPLIAYKPIDGYCNN